MGIIAKISEAQDDHVNMIHIDFASKSLGAGLIVYFLEDNGYVINYVPALNLSSYGNTHQEAQAMMVEVVLDDYFDTLLDLPKAAVAEELSRYGWSTVSRNVGDFQNSAYVDKNGILRQFNLPEDTKIEQGVLTYA